MSNPSDPKAVGKWPCSTCTYANPAHRRKCELCLTPRPKHAQSIATNPMQHAHDQYEEEPRDVGRQRSAPVHTNMNGSLPHSSREPQSLRMQSLAVKHNNNYGYDQARVSHVNKADTGKRPFHAVLPEHITFNPKKPVSEQSIFERWMIAQIERQTGQQPAVCVANNVILTNLYRARAPTTVEAIQQRFNVINTNNSNPHAINIHQMNAPHAFDAGDFTDDEDNDEEDEFSMAAGSPRSHTQKVWSETPTASDIEESVSMLNDSRILNDSGHENGGHVNGNNLENKNGYGHNRVMSTDAYTAHYHAKKVLNERRQRRTHRKDMTVAQLWFKAQSQLTQGKNPSILRKYNVQLQNIRSHNPRFRDFQRRRSHLEKAASYLQVTGHALNNKGMQHLGVIDDDPEDDDEELDEDDCESKSQPSTPYTPHTPQSLSRSQNNQSQNLNLNQNNQLQQPEQSAAVPEHYID